MIVLKGAYNVEEFDMLRLNQRKEFICLQSLPHKGCVQRPTSCLSIINLDSSRGVQWLYDIINIIFLRNAYTLHYEIK